MNKIHHIFSAVTAVMLSLVVEANASILNLDIPIPESNYSEIMSLTGYYSGTQFYRNFSELGNISIRTENEFITARNSSTIVLGGDPSVDVTATVYGNVWYAEAGLESTAYLKYYYDIVGPENTIVPVLFTASGFVSGGVGGEARLESDSGLLGQVCTLQGCGNNGTSFSISKTALITTNKLHFLELYVKTASAIRGETQSEMISTGPGEAYIDPTVTLDPSYQNIGGYKIYFSPDITAKIPEPTSLLLLGTVLFVFSIILFRPQNILLSKGPTRNKCGICSAWGAGSPAESR